MSGCKACQQPLVLELDPEDFDEASSSAVGGAPTTVPDDLELPCGCHFHWQCLLDSSSEIAVSLSCPACNNSITSTPSGPSATNPILPHTPAEPQILTTYQNEGGVQHSLDILPQITEEAYLDANPTHRPARAYLTMCSEGDIGGIVELLQNLSNQDEHYSEEQPMYPVDILRYQDPLDGLKSGLHVAVEKNQMEVVWLLLWLASNMNSNSFPQQAVNVAQILGAARNIDWRGVDIRTLRNANGDTAGGVAERVGGSMAELVRAGIL